MTDSLEEKKKRLITKICIYGFFVAIIIAQLFWLYCYKRLDVIKVTYVYYSGDNPSVYMKVYTNDCTVKRYSFNGSWNTGCDLFAGELPPEDEYTVSEYKITQESWDRLVESLSKERFMSLPKNLQKGIVFDGATLCIQVETSSGTHKVESWMPSNGDGLAQKRFDRVWETFGELR